MNCAAEAKEMNDMLYFISLREGKKTGNTIGYHRYVHGTKTFFFFLFLQQQIDVQLQNKQKEKKNHTIILFVSTGKLVDKSFPQEKEAFSNCSFEYKLAQHTETSGDKKKKEVDFFSPFWFPLKDQKTPPKK